MPYRETYATRSVEVVGGYTITFEISTNEATQGETVTFRGKVMKDSTPVANQKVEIYRVTATGNVKVAEGTTASDGSYSISWAVSYKLGCATHAFFAKHVASGVESDRKTITVYYRTRMYISAPDRVAPNQEFEITGKLEYEFGSAGDWRPLPFARVDIYVDDVWEAWMETAEDGSFKFKTKIGTPGTHSVKVVFSGAAIGAGAGATATTYVATQVSVEELAPIAVIASMVAAALFIALRG